MCAARSSAVIRKEGKAIKKHLTSYGSGPDDGVASPMLYGGYPLLHLLSLNSVARSAARGVGRARIFRD